MAFDPAVAFAYARALARPRRVGTAANDRVIAETAERLKSFGCAVELDVFECSSRGEHAVALYVLSAQILILITFWLWGLSAWVAVLPALILAALILFSGQLFRLAARASLSPLGGTRISALRRWWLARGPRYRTANIVARVPVQAGAAPRPGLILMAHSDSKSQALPLPARMALVGVASLAACLFTLLTIVRVFVPAVTSWAALAGVVALVAGLPLMFLYIGGSGNASPGAVDNASGVGLVVHLAECLCAAPPLVPVTVVITGAEELGLLGAMAYLRDVGREALRGARILNVDGIGTSGRLAIAGGGSGGLAQAVAEAARAQQIPLGRLLPIGAQFDHLPFADAGLDALTLATTGTDALSVHTPADNVTRLDEDGFRRAGLVALEVVERLGQQ